VTERKRQVVEPLNVIDKNERRPDRSKRTMRGLEDTDRFRRRGVVRRATEHKLLESPPVRRRTG
jgi:hypothetical protein